MMSVPDGSKRFQYLKKLLENRSSSFKKMMRLRGRLDLILTHARSVSNQDTDFSQALIPLVEVDEKLESESGDEEVEHEFSEEESGVDGFISLHVCFCFLYFHTNVTRNTENVVWRGTVIVFLSLDYY